MENLFQGIYIARLATPEYTKSIKMGLLDKSEINGKINGGGPIRILHK